MDDLEKFINDRLLYLHHPKREAGIIAKDLAEKIGEVFFVIDIKTYEQNCGGGENVKGEVEKKFIEGQKKKHQI